jgi:hypothetical protein
MKTLGGVVMVAALCAVGCGDDGGATDAGGAVDAVTGPDADCTPAFTLFLNRGGGTYDPGMDSSRNNTSGILNVQHVIGEYDPGMAFWDSVVACVAEDFAPYSVLVTDAEPGDVDHMEIVVTPGDATDIGLSAQGGTSIAPFSCGVLPNSIAFLFGGATGNAGPLSQSEVCTQATWLGAKFFGLDNTVGCGDATSFGICDAAEFEDADRQCGELDPRSCTCDPEPTQNSHELMEERAGLNPCL